ncbi:polysaccharide biosynthesis protein [Clostridium aminobutyricum]|uniref:Polysaccharide biosynthesis protein n=1 Tax=Clostridium aminobutyricum TaxID=33953 RepID=A0A939DA57_CLOAM|nr:nucleoside-diphosphate sugar epimerase/dehydratase [Clostridium aminobutyricum]MBN7774032.1 polysaccharide biosynthesis protein [Clostridium aminobutyricum]
MVKFSRIAILLLIDICIVNFSYIMAYLFRFDFDVNSKVFDAWFYIYAGNIFPITLACIAAFWLLGLYTSMWRYAGTEELTKIVLAAATAQLMVIACVTFLGLYMPKGIYVISFLFMVFLLGAFRMSYRFVRGLRTPGSFNSFVLRIGRKDLIGEHVTKVMVIGAGEAGASMINEIKSHHEYGKKVVVAIDDDPIKKGHRICGVKVAGGKADIRLVARKYGVDEIIIAIPSANKKAIQSIMDECKRTRCKIKILPSLIDLINEKVSISKLRDVDIEDFLGRDPVHVNLREISSYIEGKIVMVTGGGGSIGSELCRQIGRFKPRRIIAVDIYENSVFELTNELKELHPKLELEIVIASIRDKTRMDEVFRKYKPHVIFHAAAHKHVPLMENNPKEAVLNNIMGTKNMLDLAEEHAVERFVMISTDKAVNPTNVMGATKRVGEMMLQEKSSHARTTFAAVRFGNVLGSNGSVIPIFRKQIEKGGPVTVTHPDITRYFMTIPEAVELVIQTGAMAEGGEIFILDMGEPVKILDLAENVIRLSGYVPYVDIDIALTGLRPGEKLYEELLLDEEGIEKTGHNKIYVGHPLPANPVLKEMLQETDGHAVIEEEIKRVSAMTEAEVKKWLQEIVPNYSPQQSSQQ